jgi:RNA polymerase-binding transcription factor DksA
MYAYQHLTRAQLRELRIELEHELAWLDRATNAEEEQDYSAPAPSDEDDASGHGGLAVALDGHTRTRSVQVKDALHRMANGEYGGCIRCGANIPYGRLMVLPEAAQCVSCGAIS